MRAGIGWALLAHLVPCGLTFPVVAVTMYGAASGPEAFLEGAFQWTMVVLLAVAVQGALALGCLTGVAVAASRGDAGLARGLGLGWLIGLAGTVLGGGAAGLGWSQVS